MDYPTIQLVFELVPNNIEFLSAPESSSQRIKKSQRIKNHRIKAECILAAQTRVWNKIKADHYIQKYATDMGEDNTLSTGGYMSDANP
jgi:hypothetical protein